MRLPFIQVDQDAWARAKTLGRFLKTTRREAFGVQADLWQWGLEMSPEDRIDGVFIDPEPAELLAGALEWKGSAEGLLQALIRAQLVDLVDGGVRIRGLERYDEIIQERKAEAQRKRDAAAERKREEERRRSSAGSPPDVRRNSGGIHPSDADADAEPTHTQRSKPPPPPTAGGADPAAAAWEAVQARRVLHGLKTEPKRPSGFTEWVAALTVPVQSEEFLAALDAYLGDGHIRAKGHPTSVLITADVFSSRLPRQSTAPPKQPCAACGAPADSAVWEVWLCPPHGAQAAAEHPTSAADVRAWLDLRGGP